ncbi:site-specific integrase [Mesorhizobium sp. M2D.F.Ca.ET.171.01.1.1]|uniref:tyrosine-type recombinase/integrase n=1 Tax=unclassified Mesorhizobium TaxID=325217 RepID=UPI0010923DB6|nr:MULTISPECIES: site-specific integrase [unclassified Mesorhizobium]TGS95281.1 site-specific integrase [Mesorhizobium sp. M2D.F.Ca.ET.178.01.1.1]TGT10820.1 site-specific integrase [Mesorhizobium sp. M2D.F.Ca.ET.171.01.1.1]
MSVRKRKWTTAKGVEKEAWIVDYADTKGVRRLKTFAKKKDADAFASKTDVEVREGVHVADSETVTLKEAAADWLKSCAAAGLERTTIDQYKQHVNLHIEPMIGATKLSKITVPFVRAFQEKLRAEDRSSAMVKRVTVSLGSILSDAQERGLVVRNAVHEMSKRRGSGGAGKTDKRQKARLRYGVDIPTMEEVRAIVGVQGRYRPFLVTAIFTGMRASELRGLAWADVDFDKAQIHVRRRADRYHVIGMPKSDAGQRTIPMPPMVINTLKEWRLACPKGEHDLVFPNGEGNVEWHPNIIKRGLLPTLIKAGVTVTEKGEDGKPVIKAKYTGLHSLRHWFASWCINSKADGGLELSPKAVQARMGHSSIQITFDTYGHLFPAVDEAQALADAETRLFAVNAT